VKSKQEKKFWPIEGVTRKEVIKSQNDTRLNYLRTCRSRRIMIAGISFLSLLLIISPVFSDKVSSYISAIGGLLLLIGYLSIRASVRHIADSPDELLDERQIALRDRSYLHSYRIITTIFIIFLLILFIRIDLSESAFVIENWVNGSTWFALIFFMAGLPSMVVAWVDKGEDEI
jgi:amino acid transporter